MPSTEPSDVPSEEVAEEEVAEEEAAEEVVEHHPDPPQALQPVPRAPDVRAMVKLPSRFPGRPSQRRRLP